MANEVTSFAELLRANRKNGLGPLTTLSSVLSWYRGTLRRGQTSPLGLLTIQPTPFCNINCEYCYLPERNDRSTFDLNLIEPLFQKLRVAGLLGPRLAVSWHAGDPLVLPASYYSEAIERIERLRMETRITHHFQTNGMLINDEFCKLFKRANVQVALSMDGPAFIHDRRRKTRSGEGTHAKAMRGLARLNDQNISYSGIAVLSHDSLPYPDEIYDFLRNNNFRGLGLNVEEVEGFNKHTSLCHGSEELFIRFFSRMIWRAANDGIRGGYVNSTRLCMQ